MSSENQIELDLIGRLSDLKYTYRPEICDRAGLYANFREKFEALNRVNLTDSEFKRLIEEIVNPDVYASAKLLRSKNTFEREDGTPLNYTLVNITDWCKNSFEVINQLRINTENSNHRYDVMLLINGVPVVQIELKNLPITPRRAMQQIVDYKNEPGNGYTNTLLCFIQLFIVSNQTDTWYFANNNNRHFSFDADERFLPLYQYADSDNKKITHLHDFALRFLSKCILGEMISRYMVLVASEQKLLMMRPYQIYAVQAIVECIHQNRGNGYIWHTTGSGKTLTSFKTSTLLKDNPDIEKCLFVVDRKDLDRQTREEFNKFQEGCVEENTNTETLVTRLLSDNYADKVIVTTIQKLGLALDADNKRKYKERLEPLRGKRMVFIFDECHRSQFGDNHKAIKNFFPNAQLFGFTGTPIFEKNATYRQITGEEETLKTTEDIFEKLLHAYTITHAIEDRNVLRFHVDYFKGNATLKAGEAPPQNAVVDEILDKHDTATSGRKFNAVLASSSINSAIEYFRLFNAAQAERAARDAVYRPLNIVCVFSPPAEGNKDVQQIQEDLPQEKADNQEAPDEKKAALTEIIADYNARYKTNHDINNFDLYYQDVQKRIKDQQYSNQDYPHENKIDLVIVVDMLLTGFDSKYLNTLYVDKNLKYHGLIQAFSRTNRVLNDTKPNGNILDFRGQQSAVDDAIALFSGAGDKAAQAREIWLVDPAPAVIGKLEKAVTALDSFMASQGLPSAPEQVANLKGDEARGQFINLFKEVQRLKTQLDQYTDLTPENSETISKMIPDNRLQAFRGVYLETAYRLKSQQEKKGEGKDETPPLDFEFVLFASAIIDYDYIMKLISNYTQSTPGKQSMTRSELVGLIESDAKFMNDREDIAAYIGTLKAGEGMNEKQIRDGYKAFKAEKFDRKITEIANKQGIASSSLKGFVDKIIDRMIFDGDTLSELFEPLDLGWKERTQKELALMEELIPVLDKLAQGREISGLRAYEKK
jgi:type I restriction enzyme R subunit